MLGVGITVGLLSPRGWGGPAGPVRLGAVIPLTGAFASGGAQVKAGYEIAVEDINARGGVRSAAAASGWT